MNGWANSTRRSRLPPDWATRRARVLRRDPICRHCAAVVSTEVDHIVAGDNHDLNNLQGLCGPCHQTKTIAERPVRPPRKRPPPRHPGAKP